jgi:acyl transferase domain-containing protein/aryl carrier-like protein
MTYESTGLEVAIIGMSGRFPKSKNVESFWKNLIAGVDLTSVFPDSEFKDLESNGNGSNKSNKTIKVGGVLEDVDLFDASFFGFNPREAEAMDPQHRLFLECAWEAIEDAGYDSEREERPIGVYAGVGMGTYLLYNLSPNQELMKSRGFLPTLVGVDKDYLPTRVSYKLNLTGPSVSVGTACSSSLVAVHLACQSLLSGECEMALAAGVSVKVPQNELTLSPGEIASSDGKCRAFSARANGTIGGNGIGVVVLKRLEDAIADRDRIYGVIKGSAINNDGAVKVGYTAPSEEGQAKVIRAAQIMAEVEPETIGYIEAHGTGTTLGDPIEIAALTQAFRSSTDKKGYCAIGSVKTNVGHLDATAGIAGLIKAVLALDRKLIPPSLNFEAPNPQIDFENSPFYVNTKLSEWKTNENNRRAGVSSFGFGGTNAHVILEESPVIETSSPSRSKQLLLLSAKTSSALETATANLANYLKQNPEINLADVAYTLKVGRRVFDRRRMVVVDSIEDAVTALESNSPKVLTQCQESSERSVVFMFTGQGSQYVNMARELYESESIFRQECDRCCKLLEAQLGFDLRSCLYPTESEVEKAAQQLQQTAITQPALFVIEYSLAKLWMSWGVNPVAAIGHSIGEYVAATIAGVFSLEDALVLVAARGQLMQQMPSGSMLAVSLAVEELETLVQNQGIFLQIAAINSPSSCVVSGKTEAIELLQKQLSDRAINNRLLHTSHAFHSPMMEPVVKPFLERVKQIELKSPQLPFISNLTGTWITTEEATDPSYWASHLRQTVRFAEGLQELCKNPDRVLLEVGAGRTLSKLAKQHPDKNPEQIVLNTVRHPQEQESDLTFLLNTLGQLWLSGVQVDWSGFYANEKRDRLSLPTYPFERQRYWIEAPEQSASNYQTTLEKKHSIADWFYIPSWKRSLPLVGQSKETQIRSCNLVFVDDCGLGDRLLKKLEREGEDAIVVKIGSEFAQQGENVYTLNPQQSDDYDVLFKKLVAQQKIPQKIIHLWTVTTDENISKLESIDRIQEKGFYSLLFLAQAIGKRNLTKEVKLAVISNHLQSVTGEEILSPEKATLLGVTGAIAQEYSNINCCAIDIVIPDPKSWQEKKLTDRLLTEIKAPSVDRIIAYRGNNRWIQTFEPVRLNETVEETPYLREGGVYLITGGLGGIGLVLAEHIAKTVGTKLILTGKTTLPNREEWTQWLATHDENNSISQKLRKVLELEKLGAEVLVVSADVANFDRMQAAIAMAESQFGRINGLIHAAGIPGGGAIQIKTQEEAERILAPKVKGTLVLNTIFKDAELDFFVLCSSLASVLGGFGQADYAGANAFLDAFAHYKTCTDGTFTTCINWDDWQEVGMAARMKSEVIRQKSEGLLKAEDRGLLPQEGIEVFKRIVGSKLPQVLVSTCDLLVRAEKNNTDRASENNNRSEQIQPTHSRPELNNAYVPPRNEIEQKLAEIWQQLLGIESVGIHDNFFELGGDSLISFQVALQAKQTGLQLTPNQLFEHPTIADLALVADRLETGEENLESDRSNYAESSQANGQTSSDFPTANLTQTELNKFLTKLNRHK